MHPLHDHDDPRRCLVVTARKQGGTVPFDDSRPHGLRHGVAKLERIVDDDQVSSEPGEHPSIEVAMRLPRFVVAISRSVSRSTHMVGKVAR